LRAAETTTENWCTSELHRMAGDIALMSPSPDAKKAEECFTRALSVARQQQAKSLELRAAISLARLWQAQGQGAQGHDLLAPVYGWFSEGFDTADVEDAKALLAALARG
jgi:predicted ATPase